MSSLGRRTRTDESLIQTGTTAFTKGSSSHPHFKQLLSHDFFFFCCYCLFRWPALFSRIEYEREVRESFPRILSHRFFPLMQESVAVWREPSEPPEENSEATLFISDDCRSQKASWLTASVLKDTPKYFIFFNMSDESLRPDANCFILQRPEHVGAEYWSIGSHVGTQCCRTNASCRSGFN